MSAIAAKSRRFGRATLDEPSPRRFGVVSLAGAGAGAVGWEGVGWWEVGGEDRTRGVQSAESAAVKIAAKRKRRRSDAVASLIHVRRLRNSKQISNAPSPSAARRVFIRLLLLLLLLLLFRFYFVTV